MRMGGVSESLDTPPRCPRQPSLWLGVHGQYIVVSVPSLLPSGKMFWHSYPSSGALAPAGPAGPAGPWRPAGPGCPVGPCGPGVPPCSTDTVSAAAASTAARVDITPGNVIRRGALCGCGCSIGAAPCRHSFPFPPIPVSLLGDKWLLIQCPVPPSPHDGVDQPGRGQDQRL
jgi:hypothetical protein